MAQNSIQQKVKKYSDENHIPAWIVGDIVQVESQGNPNAVGDNGSSYGLLQLHYGGQGNGYTEQQLLNPSENLKIGIPPIAKAYQQAKSKGISNPSQLLDYVANHSGHPDDMGVAYTNKVEPGYDITLNKMQSKYGTNLPPLNGTGSTGVGNSGTNGGSLYNPAPVTTNGYNGLARVFKQIDNLEQSKIPMLHISLFGIAMILLGIAIVIIGFVGVVARKTPEIIPVMAGAMA